MHLNKRTIIAFFWIGNDNKRLWQTRERLSDSEIKKTFFKLKSKSASTEFYFHKTKPIK